MKSYNSCDDPNPIDVIDIKVVPEPAKSLLTGLKKISPSASAAFLVGILEAVCTEYVAPYMFHLCLFVVVHKSHTLPTIAFFMSTCSPTHSDITT